MNLDEDSDRVVVLIYKKVDEEVVRISMVKLLYYLLVIYDVYIN